MVTVSLRRNRQLNGKIIFSGTKSGIITSFIITGIGVYAPGKFSDLSLYDAIKNHKDKQISINLEKKINNKTIDLRHNKKINLDSLGNNNSLSIWLSNEHSNDELRKIFINMDLAMKYIHDRGYCIKSFSPKQIEILNNSLEQIKYNTLLEMPNNLFDKKELVKEDIYSSAFLQIGAYLNNKSLRYTNQSIDKFLDNLRPTFLKDNFDEISAFLPESDVLYYRGVIKMGVSVYLNDYIEEKKKRDLVSLEKKLGGDSDNAQSNNMSDTKKKGNVLVKSNGHSTGIYNNDQINSNIYSQLNKPDAAYIISLMIPILMVIGGAALMILAYVLGMN